MIRRSLLVLPLLIAPLAVAWNPPPAAPVVQEDTALQLAMDTLKNGQRSLKKLIAEPVTNEEAILKTLVGMEAATITALGETPLAPDGMSGKKLSHFKVGYRHMLAKLLVSLIGMQEATLNADAAALKTGYDELSAGKKSGHKEYRDF